MAYVIKNQGAPMTEAQCEYLTKLICTLYASNAGHRAAALVEMMGFTKGMASSRIDVLKAALAGKPLVQLNSNGTVVAPQTLAYTPPAAHYMVNGQHVWVKEGKYNKASLTLEVAGAWYGPISTQKAITWLNEHLGSQSVALACVLEYAKVTSKCGVCNTKLTNPKSIAAGIGPVCAKSYGIKI